jgi:hypothetical protein
MSDGFTIGDWVRRPRGSGRQKWHLVESVVAEDAVTRCGRRMDRVTPSGGELQVSDVMPLTRMIGQPQLCKAGCESRPTASDLAGADDEAFEAFVETSGIRTASEDDGSTQPEMVP